MLIAGAVAGEDVSGLTFPAIFILPPFLGFLSGFYVWLIVKVFGWPISKISSKRQRARGQFEAEKAEMIAMIDKALEKKERARAVHQVAGEEEGDDPDEEEKRLFIQEDIEYAQKEIEELQREHEKWRGLLTTEDKEVKRFAQEEERFIKEQMEMLNDQLEELRLSVTSQEEEGKKKRR